MNTNGDRLTDQQVYYYNKMINGLLDKDQMNDQHSLHAGPINPLPH